MNKKGSETVWSNFLHIVLFLLILGAILGVLYATGILDKLVNAVSPKCPVACKAVANCDLETEYEHGTARCEGKQTNLKCCLKYDDKNFEGGGGTFGGGGSSLNFDKEGESCDSSTTFKIFDYKGDCVSKCVYCADSTNTKERKDICKDSEIRNGFSCSCTLDEINILKPLHKGFTGYCPKVDEKDLYCCERFDKSAPQLTINANPLPTANTYFAHYDVEITCKDESLNGPGIGCDKNFKYFLLRDNIPVSGMEKNCESVYFKDIANTAFTENKAMIAINESSLTLFNGKPYVTGEGFKGSVYVVFCAKDKLGNTVIQKSTALPLIVAGSLTNCLKSSATLVEKRCVNLPVPCFKDNGEKATDPKEAGLLCSGVEFYYASLTACSDDQKTMPLCQS